MNGFLVFCLIALFLVLVVFAFWRFWFCRDPRRTAPYGKEVLVSPANGTVATVRRFGAPTLHVKKWNAGSVDVWTKDVARSGHFILIVMTPLNVHYQRSPTSAKVVATKHVPGRFLNALKDPDRLLTLANERNDILLEAPWGRFKVVQIAGALARRIRCDVRAGQEVEKGQTIGFINLGSQVALILPEHVVPAVKKGDVVVDGETVIARVTKRPAAQPGKQPGSGRRR